MLSQHHNKTKNKCTVIEPSWNSNTAFRSNIAHFA